MNTKAKKVFLTAFAVALLFSVLTAGARTYALLFHYTPSLGHFTEGLFADVFLPLIYILAAVAFLLFGALFRESLTGRAYKTTLPTLFAAGFAAIATAVWLISFASDFFTVPHAPVQTVCGILLLLFGAATVLYLFLNALPHPPYVPTLLAGIGTILFCLVFAFYAYFDTALTLNSPIKIFDQITFLVLVLFFLAEGRFRQGAMHEAVFLPVCMMAVTLCASASLSGLIYTAVESRPLVVLVMHDFLLFGFFLYTLARLLSFALPTYYTSEDLAAAIEQPTVFAADEIPIKPADDGDFAQESFDFDAKTETFDITPANDKEQE